MATSRERLEQTLNHQEPDQLVVDMGSTAITGINAHALHDLRNALHLEERKVKICEPLQLLGEVEEDVRQALHLDCVDLSNGYNMFGFSNEGRKPWTMQTGLDVDVPTDFNTTVDEKGRTYLYPQGDMSAAPSAMMPKGGFFFDNIVRGNVGLDCDDDELDGRADFDKDYGILTDEQLKYMEKKCDYYYNNTDYGIVYSGAITSIGDFALISGPGVKNPTGIRNLEDFMMAHCLHPDYIHEVFSLHVERGLKNAELIRQACGNKIQAIYVSGTDFGTQKGPFMSLDSFREFYKPYFKQVNDWIHKNTTWKTFYHTCGAVSDFLQDFYEADIDILNPIQLSAKGMDARELKEKWGDKFVFWGGGVDTQKTLPFGTPEEVYKEVSERLNIFAKGGGFVFNTIHNIQCKTSAENLLAMFKAIEDYNAGIRNK